MNDQEQARGLTLFRPPPGMAPALDPGFRPAVLATRAFREAAQAARALVPVRIALEQADRSIALHETVVFADTKPEAAANFFFLERLLKFLLWSRGGYRIYLDGPPALGRQLEEYYRATVPGRFDAAMMSERIYERPFEIVLTPDLPASTSRGSRLGRHLDGCRIGFDLGGSDRKVAAVQDGRTVFSEETPWDPIPQADPQYHFDGIMESLKRAAAHLGRVDAIGGSAAGVYVNNRVRVASLFSSVPPDQFDRRVKGMLFELRQAWGGIPLEVVNDGEVTALAGSMALGNNAVLGIALGTSTAAGYVTRDGTITTWLNELAFAPLDFNPDAPVEEWSGDRGVGALYLSQQAVGRLLPRAGIVLPADRKLPEQLADLQRLMAAGDERAARVYQTLGVYLGYAIALYADFYDLDHVLALGRVTSGPGGAMLVSTARQVLRSEFGDLAERVAFHMPDETTRRHGQAVAAASLPELVRESSDSISR